MIYVFDDFELDAARGELRYQGKVVDAEAMAIRLLACLVDTPGRLVTKDELIDRVWEGRALADNAITVCVARLRKVLRRCAGDRNFVTTVYGQGYRFVRGVTRSSHPEPYLSAPDPASDHDTAPCVGRDRVIERMHRLYENAVNRQGSVCAVMGSAGVGKTRVVETFERRLGPRQPVVWAYCRDRGTAPPLAPWLRLLRTLLLDAWSPQLAKALGPHAPEVGSWLGLEPAESDGGSQPQAGAQPSGNMRSRRASFEAILTTLRLVSQETPLCLVLDDLHRADATSLELLDMMLDEIGHTRILLLCTVRQAEGGAVRRPDTHLPAILGHRNCERLPLARLGRPDVATYLQARLGEVDARVVDAVLAGSEGIPFFMVELVRQLEASRPIDPASLSVPAAALELFRDRVGSLTETAQRVLRAAAVIGRAFELALLQEACELPPQDVLAGIDEAIAFDILVAAPGTASAFAFEHELMCRAIYEALPQAERRRLHLKIAGAMERRGVVNDQRTNELAYHLHAALPEGDPDKVVQYCQQAAWAAGTAHANPDAATHLRHALEALSLKRVAQPRHCAFLHLFHAIYTRGQAGSRESLEVARRIGYELGDGTLLEKVGFMYNPHPILCPVASAHALLEHALTVLRPDDKMYRASVLADLACTAPGCFDRTITDERLGEALELLPEVTKPNPRYHVLLAELHLHGGPAHRERRPALRRELCELARKHPNVLPVLPVDLALDHALNAMQGGDLDEADAALEQAARRSRAINHRELQWHVQRLGVWSKFERSPSNEFVAELGQLQRRAARTEIAGMELFCAFDRCMLAIEGHKPFLDDTDLLALAHAPHDPVHVWAMKIRALVAAGHEAEARESLYAVPPDRIAELPNDAQVLGSLGQIASAAMALHEPEYARAVAAYLGPYADRFAINISYVCEGPVAHVLGAVWAYLREPGRARDLMAQAVEVSKRAGFARSLGRTREALTQL
ncbi:MAG: AAA family ATPase [Myxococcales bacterium]|nr:AAA family ATPase [Myxococcales bacterium]